MVELALYMQMCGKRATHFDITRSAVRQIRPGAHGGVLAMLSLARHCG